MWSLFTSLRIWISNSLGENASFGFGRSGQWRNRRPSLGVSSWRSRFLLGVSGWCGPEGSSWARQEHSLGAGVEARAAALESAFVLHGAESGRLGGRVVGSLDTWPRGWCCSRSGGSGERLYVIGYRFWLLGLQSGRLVWYVASGPMCVSVFVLLRFVRQGGGSRSCCMVSTLVVRVTESPAHLGCSLGAGVCECVNRLSFELVFLVNGSILFFYMKRLSVTRKKSSCRGKLFSIHFM